MFFSARSEDLLVFQGGMPMSHGDRHTLSCVQGERHSCFDFGSNVIDFVVVRDDVTGRPHALLVMCEEELVAIDLLHEQVGLLLKYMHKHFH